jgi:hypothetical protein
MIDTGIYAQKLYKSLITCVLKKMQFDYKIFGGIILKRKEDKQ